MARAISGATVVREWEGPYTNTLLYRRRCEVCGLIPTTPPITVRCLPGQRVMHGSHHEEGFVCSFCGHRQVVELEG